MIKMAKENKDRGCWNCEHLGFYDAYYEESSSSGYTCEYREVDNFKTFPCNRRLKCFNVDVSQKGGKKK